MLTVALMPMPIEAGNKQENLNHAHQRLARLGQNVDVVVLPELFSTGFVPDRDALAELAESVNGPTFDTLRQWAGDYHLAIAGSVMCRVGGALLNRGFFIEPGGEETFYDKHHLFSASREGQTLHSGTSLPPVVRFRGWNLSLAICYDLRFPAWLRQRQPALYDAMLLPANWPESRRHAWDTLLRARAIENQAYVLGCDCAGEDKFGAYPLDMTMAVDYMGNTIKGDRRDDGTLVVTLSKTPLYEFRQRFPALNDADRIELLR